MEAQNENSILKRDLTNAIKYSETLESVLSKIGYDLSKVSVFLVNREKNEFQDDIKDIEELGKNLSKLFEIGKVPDYKIKMANAEFIEKALYQLLRNYPDKDYPLIKDAIKNTRIKSFPEMSMNEFIARYSVPADSLQTLEKDFGISTTDAYETLYVIYKSGRYTLLNDILKEEYPQIEKEKYIQVANYLFNQEELKKYKKGE